MPVDEYGDPSTRRKNGRPKSFPIACLTCHEMGEDANFLTRGVLALRTPYLGNGIRRVYSHARRIRRVTYPNLASRSKRRENILLPRLKMLCGSGQSASRSTRRAKGQDYRD